VDTYERIPEKISRSFAHIYKHHSGYDWYLKTDDDTFIIMMNLRRFLRDKEPTKAITYGYNYVKYVRDGYHSGGAGYLLSGEALKRVGRKLNEDIKFCVRSNMEDVDIALCLRDLGVQVGQSVDEFGRERFHPLTLRDHFYGIFPRWMHRYSQNEPKKVGSINSIREEHSNYYSEF
jgi:glycoprotein-N-acetylgalactosamine 3-beta-galactosyltransferase